MFILEQRYGNDGYAFWFKLLETLGDSEGHFIDLNDPIAWEFLQSKTRLPADICAEILDLLAKLDAIDQELWESKVVWSDNFLKQITEVYRNRRVDAPLKPTNYTKEPASNGITTCRKPQRRGEERRGEKRKASSPPAPPYQKIIDLWNAHAPELLPRASLTETRKPKIKTAWKEHPDLEWWKVLFADISLSSWHSHRDKWRGCSFDWILKKRTEMREKLDAIKKSNGGAHHPPGKAVNLPEDPPGILVFDPSCPVCHGDGFKTMGKCKCARTREEIHANQKATASAQ